jgi:hypothetical protein
LGITLYQRIQTNPSNARDQLEKRKSLAISFFTKIRSQRLDRSAWRLTVESPWDNLCRFPFDDSRENRTVRMQLSENLNFPAHPF